MLASELFRKPAAARDRPIVALFGDDDFLRRRALQSILSSLFESGDPGLGLGRFEGPKADLAAVLDEVRTLPFLAPRRVVVVEDADPFVTAHRKELEAYAERPSPAGVLVLLLKSWPPNTRLAKLVEAKGLSVDCKTPREAELAGLVAQMVRAAGAEIAPDAAALLVELIGPEPGRFDSEIQKLLVAVAPATRIRRDDVARYVDGGRIESLWKLLDLATTGETAAALTALQRLIESGEAPVGLVAGAWKSLQKVHHAGELRRRHRPHREACAQAGIPPFAAEKTEAQHGHLGWGRVDELPELFLRLDLDLKGSSALDARTLLERLVVRLGAPRRDA